jgi:hypothetical protein
MSLKDAREQHEVWVFYRLSSGAVVAVTYNQPTDNPE